MGGMSRADTSLPPGSAETEQVDARTVRVRRERKEEVTMVAVALRSPMTRSNELMIVSTEDVKDARVDRWK
jgi:hypothetical protein